MSVEPVSRTVPSKRELTVAIAEDHAVIRDGLRLLLEATDDVRVVAEAEDVQSTIDVARRFQPSVLLLDLNLHGALGLDVLPALRQHAARTAVVVLTMQGDPSMARRALREGVLGYVLKDAAATELVRAVRTAAAGRTYLQPELGARMATIGADEEGSEDNLSDRELQVLRLIALGHTNREIADRLVLSVRTVESHRAHLHQKLRAATRAELVRYALTRGLLEL